MFVAVDSRSNVFVSDASNNRIREIAPTGEANTFAGNGHSGSADGTGGPFGTAEFNGPSGIAFDGQGNLFVGDSGNSRIRKIDQFGNVTTVAGNGTHGWVDGTGGPNGTAEFGEPIGVAVDSHGNIFVADMYYNCIRKIDSAGNVTTLAGNGAYGFLDGTGGSDGTARFRGPFGIAVDAQDNVLVADSGNNNIRKVDPLGNVTTLAGDGIAGDANGSGGQNGAAQFWGPAGVAVDAQGNVFVGDSENFRIRKIDPTGNVTTVAGHGHGFADGPIGDAMFNDPYGVTTDTAGNVFVADVGSNRIRKVSP